MLAKICGSINISCSQGTQGELGAGGAAGEAGEV